ncbi:MAG: LamG domain-containing protein, partial [Planctomycetota bacterium]
GEIIVDGDWRASDSNNTIGIFNFNGGAISCDNFKLGDEGGGEFNFRGGIVDVGDDFNLCCRLGNPITFNMTEGYLAVGDNFRAPSEGTEEANGVVVMHLDGGVISCAKYDPKTGYSMDITEGELLIGGNVKEEIDVNHVGKGYITAFSGAKAVQVTYEPTADITIVRAAIPRTKSWYPEPFVNVGNVCPTVTLSWRAGEYASHHNVYFGTGPADVAKGASPVDTGVTDTNWTPPAALDLDTIYWWRIDDVNVSDPCTYMGTIWRFRTESGKIRDVWPINNARGVDPNNSALRWTESCLAAWHDVYFGTDFNDVNDATSVSHPNTVYNRIDVNNWDPSPLPTYSRYYWRVDEVTSGGAVIAKGTTRGFKTGYGGILLYLDFDGTKGQTINEITDSVGGRTFERYEDEDDPNSAVKYAGPANPFFNDILGQTSGTDAEFTAPAGLFWRDPCPNVPDTSCALRLDGVGYTVETWIRPRTFPEGTIGVVGKWDAWGIEINQKRLRTQQDDEAMTADDRMAAEEWYHVAAVFDRSVRRQLLYVDGHLLESETQSSINPSDNNSPVAIGCRLEPEEWDEDDEEWNPEDYDNFFDGDIDDIVILDIVLKPGEFLLYPDFSWAHDPSPYDKEPRVDPCDPNLALVWVPGESAVSQELYFGLSYDDVHDASTSYDPCGVLKVLSEPNSYHVGATLDYFTNYYWRVDTDGVRGLVWQFKTRSKIVDPNLWLWYKFDEEIGGDIYDSSGRDFYGYDGSAHGQWDPDGGQWDGALWCDDDIGFEVDTDVMSNIKNGITVSVWLKEAYRQGSNNWVFSAGDDDNETYLVEAAVVSSDGMAVWRAGNDTNDVLRWDLDETDPSKLGGWHHWAFVKDEIAGTISMYFDGDLVDSNDKAAVSLSKVPRDEFRIGATVDHGTDYQGWIDDFRLYDYAKSTKEIEALYRGGDLGLAWKPDPFNGEPDVVRDLPEVTWKAGNYAVTHDIYFGTDLTAVTDANTSVTLDVYKGSHELADTNYVMPGELELNQTYYWRIDEVNDSNLDSPWKGRVWKFKVASYIIIEDFESYDLSTNLLADTWMDGIRPAPPPYYIRYVSGAVVYLGASYMTPPDPVHRGEQSMSLDYANDGWGMGVPYYSEVERIFGTAQDWTEADVEILTVFFYGDPNNDANSTEQMYVVLNDGDSNGLVEYGRYVDEDMNDIKKAEWQQWDVALADFGVTLTNIERMYIGFGNRPNPVVPGGWGFVYFDNVRLYRRKCVATRLKPDYDYNNDCIVDFREIASVAAEWLRTDVNFTDLGLAVDAPAAAPIGWWKLDEGTGTFAEDSSALDNHGTVQMTKEGGYSWVTGYDGVHSAVEFDGGKVIVADAAALRPQYEVSASAWVYYSTNQNSGRVVVKGADNKETYSLEIDDDEASFHVRDANNKLFGSTNGVWRNEWVHLGGTFDGDSNTLRCYVNGELVGKPAEKTNVTFVTKGGTLSQDPCNLAIGNRPDANNREFEGTIDDVRVYDYALSASEVRYLATDGTGYVPLRSQFNIYDVEPVNKQAINMKDMAFIADAWMEQKLWPPLP